MENLFKYKKVNVKDLIKYGFDLNKDIYRYQTDILGGDLILSVFVDASGEVSTRVEDKVSSEEYILHKLPDSEGEYVGRVKNEIENILLDIRNKCFEDEVFKSKQAKTIINFAKENYSDELEFLWEKSPDIAVLRRKDSKKWYAVMFVLSKRKLGIDSDDVGDIIDLHIPAGESENIVDNKTIFAGYHMNKKRWITICLDDSVPTKRLLELVKISYQLA